MNSYVQYVQYRQPTTRAKSTREQEEFPAEQEAAAAMPTMLCWTYGGEREETNQRPIRDQSETDQQGCAYQREGLERGVTDV